MQENFQAFIVLYLIIILNDIVRFEFKNLLINISFNQLLMLLIIDLRFLIQLIIMSKLNLNWTYLIVDPKRLIRY